jgi:hypothetical protein
VKEFYLGGSAHADTEGQHKQRWKRRKTWR